MKTNLLTKGVVLGIIMLFLGTSIIPTINADLKLKQSQPNQIKTMNTSGTVYSVLRPSSNTWTKPDELPTTTHPTSEIYSQQHKTRGILVDNNTLITEPLDNDIFHAGITIEITGTANGTGFQYYTIEWGTGENPSEWYTSGITLINSGVLPIINGALAIWNTSAITAGGYVTLRLTVNNTDHQNQTLNKDIYLDPTLKEGWPVRIPYYYNPDGPYFDWAGYLEPAVADINNDGHAEITVYVGGDPSTLMVFHDDGSLLWSAPVGNTEASGGNLHYPVLGDINNDGYLEIIVFRYMETQASQVYAFDHDGNVLAGFPVNLPKEYHPTLLIADVNADGYNDIVFQGNNANDRKMVILNHDGTIIAQWSLWVVGWGASCEPSPAVGNFDSDPELEIVSTGPSENAGYDQGSGEWINEGRIDVYNINGTEVTGWPKYTEGVIFSSPVTGDINNDGSDDIIVGLMFAGNAPDDRYGGLWAFDSHGNVLPGFPVEKGWNFESAPALADFDHDGYLEIVTSRLGFYTYIIRHDGTMATGWPQMTNWNDYYSPVIGDINGDGSLDVVTTAGNGFYPSIYSHGGVWAWNFDGTKISGFPLVTDCDAQAPATIADVDQDGKVEIIASSDWDYDFTTQLGKNRGSLYVWDYDSTFDPVTMIWPTFHRDIERTGMYPYTYTPLPVLTIGNITGGLLRVKTTVTNIGEAAAEGVMWNISVAGGLIFSGKESSGTISTLNISEEHSLASKLIFGFGKVVITVTATVPGQVPVTRDQNASIRLFFIRMN
jgi:hypothetical protein